MASGDTLFVLYPQEYIPPSANFATLDTVSDGSTPNIVFPVLDFNGTTDSHADWIVELPSHYSGTTGLTFKYKYAMDGADVNIVEMEFRVLEIADLDILTADLLIDGKTAAPKQDTPAGTADKINVTTTIALAKASFGSASAGATLIIRATRDISAATNTDDLQLLSITVTDT